MPTSNGPVIIFRNFLISGIKNSPAANNIVPKELYIISAKMLMNKRNNNTELLTELSSFNPRTINVFTLPPQRLPRLGEL